MYSIFKNLRWLFFLIIFFQSILLSAQTNIVQTSIGAKLGLSDAKQNIKPAPKTLSAGWKTGIYIGIPIELLFSKKFAIQIEPSFIQKGSYYYKNEIHYNKLTTINYFELPIYLKLIMGNKIKFNLIAGPSASIATGGETRESWSLQTQPVYFSKDSYSRFDFNINAGAGIKMPVKKKSIIIDIRYFHGLFDISNEKTNTTKIKNRGLIATAGVMF